MMNRFARLVVVPLIVIAGGCMGGGPDMAAAGPSKQKVLALMKTGIQNSKALNQGQNPAGPRAARSGAKALRTPPRLVSRIARGSAPRHIAQPTPGGNPIIFDDQLGVWVEFVSEDEQQYFEDEAMTKPAGHDITTFTYSDTGYTIISDQVFLAGVHQGERSHIETTWSNDSSGDIVGQGADSRGTFTFHGHWNPDFSSSWTQSITAPDGSKQEYTKAVAADFSSDITMTTLGINYHWHFNSDGSGNGTITGQGQGLPATMTWDTAGVGVITWSDGTTSPFDGVKTL